MSETLGANEVVAKEIILSGRQREILQLWMEGRSWKEVAAALNLSGKTVSTHKECIGKKIGSHHPAALVRYALSSGLLEA